MKLINNQDQLLFNELSAILSEESKVYICTSYLSIPAIFELSEQLQKVKSIEILVDNRSIDKDIRFAEGFNDYSQPICNWLNQVKQNSTIFVNKLKGSLQ